MRVDTAGARTWLLAVTAGWALLVWLLALLGMGGHVARLGDDASLAQRLPSPPPAVPERVGALLQYGEIASRPLFATDRRPQPFVLQQEGEGGAEEQPFDFVLTSVLLTPTVQVAIVQPTAGGESVSMKLGEAPEDAHGWRLVSLQPRSATFDGPQGQKTLELRTFDGTGGQAPTAVARPPADRPATATTPTPTSTPVPLPPATSRPATTTAPARTATAPAAAPPPTTPEDQMEAIRKRIEARRAQLRAEAQRNQNQQPPAKP